jgi:chromate reductase, NAD(P)H dehydrogenase (quinone)
MKILSFAGSFRQNSLNKKFAQAATAFLKGQGVDIEYIDIKDYAAPVYDGDLESASGLPESIVKLNEKIAAVDGLILSTPEYNGSIPGGLKNTLDWVSRAKPMPLAGKHILLMSITPSGMGGIRGLWHTRVPFEAVGVHVYPNMVGVAKADDSFFSSDGTITREDDRKRLEETLQEFKAFLSSFKS